MKKIALILCVLFASLSVQPVFAQQEKKSVTSTIGSYDELKELIQSMAMKLRTKAKVRLEKGFKSRNTAFKNLNRNIYFNYATGYSYRWRTDSPYISFDLTLADNAVLYAAYRNPQLRARLNARELQSLEAAEACVARAVQPGMSRREIIRALHDEVAAICEYDHGNWRNQSCVSVFVRGKGACGAYTRVLWLLLAMNDIRSHVIQGSEKRGGPHCWNLVEFDENEWYHVDVTWDDQKPVSHHYFGLTDAQIKKDHRWDMKSYPRTSR